MGVDSTAAVGGASSPEESMGTRLREFRLARRLSLRALASRAQTSPGFLSQLERGQVNASVSTLRKLAGGLGITVSDLFRDDDVNQPTVLRRGSRPEIHAGNLTSKYLLSQKPLRNLEVYAGEFLPGGNAGEAYAHGDAQEILVVVAGSVMLELAGIEYLLHVGDSAEYRTSVLHTVRNAGASTAEVLWIISPPTTSIP
jgi:Predicted transcriptional regulators